MSRHTALGNGITRSLGAEDGTDFVVGIREDGMIVIREEPMRRLRRGEKLREVVVDPWQVWRDKSAVSTPDEVLDRLLKAAPIAKFEEATDPKKIPYLLKVWLLRTLGELKKNDTEQSGDPDVEDA